jgi:hypothetical protein
MWCSLTVILSKACEEIVRRKCDFAGETKPDIVELNDSKIEM